MSDQLKALLELSNRTSVPIHLPEGVLIDGKLTERPEWNIESKPFTGVGLPEKVVWIEVKERVTATNEVKTLVSYVLYQVPASS